MSWHPEVKWDRSTEDDLEESEDEEKTEKPQSIEAEKPKDEGVKT